MHWHRGINTTSRLANVCIAKLLGERLGAKKLWSLRLLHYWLRSDGLNSWLLGWFVQVSIACIGRWLWFFWGGGARCSQLCCWLTGLVWLFKACGESVVLGGLTLLHLGGVSCVHVNGGSALLRVELTWTLLVIHPLMEHVHNVWGHHDGWSCTHPGWCL